jgi:pimeloyl-ACP methyl ester carboxylesterase
MGSISGTDVRLVSVRTADGVLLRGAAAGPEGADTGVLAVHGAWGNFYSGPPSAFLDVAPEAGMRVVSLNLRSHDLGSLGDGEPCIGFARHRFEDGAVDLDAAHSFLRAEGVSRILVAAHSYGGTQAGYWLANRSFPEVAGLLIASPGPPLDRAVRWFVEGPLDDHRHRARAAIDADEPHRLLVLSSTAPVPMVVEAATMLDVWGPETNAVAHEVVRSIELPLLVTSGRREPSVYRDYAAEVAAAAPDGELVSLDDDHYYSADREGFVETVLGFAARRRLFTS